MNLYHNNINNQEHQGIPMEGHYFFDITMADHDSVAATTHSDTTTSQQCLPCINTGGLFSDPISIASLVMGALIAALVIVIVVLCCCLRSYYKRYRKLSESEGEGGVPLEDRNRSNEADHRTDHNDRRTDQHNKT